jgi:hypothetical protein
MAAGRFVLIIVDAIQRRGAPRAVGAGALFGMVGLTLPAPLTSAAVHISEALRARPAADIPDLAAPAAVP